MAYYNKSPQNNGDGKNAEDRALDTFANMMIEKIESLGSKDGWQKPWFTEGTLSWPKNLSGREYNGMNALLLTMLCEKKGYELPVFCTFNRAVGLNYQTDKQGNKKQMVDANGEPLPKVGINKGEKSFPVMLTSFTIVHKETKEKIPYDDYKRMSAEEQKEYNVYPKLNVYQVFNVAQTNLKEARPELYAKLEAENKPEKALVKEGDMYSFPAVDRMFKEQRWICPINIEHQDNAFYSISRNQITIPEKSQFKDGESWYGTAFHEMVHSTGAEDQLNRLKPQSGFGSDEYAREELVAELGSALVCQKYGMTKNLKEDSAAYLKSWLGSLKESPSFIKTTLMDVKKATSILSQRIDEVALEMKEQQSEDVAASVSDEKKDTKDIEQSASSNDNEQTEVEEEKNRTVCVPSVTSQSVANMQKSKMRSYIIMCRHLGFFVLGVLFFLLIIFFW